MEENEILPSFEKQLELWRIAVNLRKLRQKHEDTLEQSLRVRLEVIQNDENLTKKEARETSESLWEQIRQCAYRQLVFSNPEATSFETLPIETVVPIGNTRLTTLIQILGTEEPTVQDVVLGFEQIKEYYGSTAQQNVYINGLKVYGIYL